MNVENDFQKSDELVADIAPTRSRKKWWLAGCGCLSMMAILCVAGGAFVWFTFGRPLIEFNNENVALAKDSPEVKEALGPPIQTGAAGPPSAGGPGEIITRVPVSGTKGNGYIVVHGKFDQTDTSMKWVRMGLRLEVDGKVIEIDPEKAEQELVPEIEIDFGN